MRRAFSDRKRIPIPRPRSSATPNRDTETTEHCRVCVAKSSRVFTRRHKELSQQRETFVTRHRGAQYRVIKGAAVAKIFQANFTVKKLSVPILVPLRCECARTLQKLSIRVVYVRVYASPLEIHHRPLAHGRVF